MNKQITTKMDIKNKYQLLEKLIQVEDDEILEEVKKILEKVPGRLSIAQYSRLLEEADDQIEKGDYISQEDLEKESGQW